MRSWDLYAYFVAGLSDQASTVYALSTGRAVEMIPLPRYLYSTYGLLVGAAIIMLVHTFLFALLFTHRLYAPRFIKSKRLEAFGLTANVAVATLSLSFFGITAFRNIVEVTIDSIIPAAIIPYASLAIAALFSTEYLLTNYHKSHLGTA